jgi:3,4-dihydroxy 2-butanone 4-phosphate synthase/GTP cyclohydrolase II
MLNRPETSAPLRAAITAFGEGRPVLLVGGVQDSGSGPPLHFLALSGERVTPESLNALARLSGGMLYVCLEPERISALGLRRSSLRNEHGWQQRLLQSFDAATSPHRGISMAARAAAVRLSIDPMAGPRDVRQPGHMFALEAAPGGTLERLGFTEAAIDLARIVGTSATVITEVLSPTGEIADDAQLRSLVEDHGVPAVTVSDIARYRAHSEDAWRVAAEAALPTEYGMFKAIALTSHADDAPCVALTSGDLFSGTPLISVHRRCVGAALRSTSCSCRAEIDRAMRLVAREGGIVLYLPRPPEHDPAAGGDRDRTGAFSDRELAAIALRALGITRVRAIAPGPLTEPGPDLGLDIVDAVDAKEALACPS